MYLTSVLTAFIIYYSNLKNIIVVECITIHACMYLSLFWKIYWISIEATIGGWIAYVLYISHFICSTIAVQIVSPGFPSLILFLSLGYIVVLLDISFDDLSSLQKTSPSTTVIIYMVVFSYKTGKLEEHCNQIINSIHW